MYNKVIFYCHFGNGDIFESREFVKRWINLVPADEYYYSHGKDTRILLDMPNVKFKSATEHMLQTRGIWDDRNGNLYVNTWIGRDWRYVLPGIGCTVERLLDMHNDMLSVYSLGRMDEPVINYVPTIDYSAYNIGGVDKFVSSNKNEMIFIDNGLVQSSQAENFDISPAIEYVSSNNPDKTFIVTHRVDFDNSNVVYTGDIIGSNTLFDLNEVSYISRFCTTLIGRNSGPHVFSQVRENVSDSNKKLLSFTYHPLGSSFVVNTDVKITKYWSGATDDINVINKMEEVINE